MRQDGSSQWRSGKHDAQHEKGAGSRCWALVQSAAISKKYHWLHLLDVWPMTSWEIRVPAACLCAMFSTPTVAEAWRRPAALKLRRIGMISRQIVAPTMYN